MRPSLCVPARLDSYERTFDVAFPNDGSQPDKIYRGGGGIDPTAVLFANIRPAQGRIAVNGILVGVHQAALEQLRARELRYDLVDVTAGVHAYIPWRQDHGTVLAFIGKPEFTGASSVREGVVPCDYLDTILDGVEDWERRCPGFGRDFDNSTRAPTPNRVASLHRVDIGTDRPPCGASRP